MKHFLMCISLASFPTCRPSSRSSHVSQRRPRPAWNRMHLAFHYQSFYLHMAALRARAADSCTTTHLGKYHCGRLSLFVCMCVYGFCAVQPRREKLYQFIGFIWSGFFCHFLFHFHCRHLCPSPGCVVVANLVQCISVFFAIHFWKANYMPSNQQKKICCVCVCVRVRTWAINPWYDTFISYHRTIRPLCAVCLLLPSAFVHRHYSHWFISCVSVSACICFIRVIFRSLSLLCPLRPLSLPSPCRAAARIQLHILFRLS